MRVCKAVATLWLEEEVRRATREISPKYVVEPSIDEIETDLLIGLRRYIRSVRIKYHQIERLRKEGIEPEDADLAHLFASDGQDNGLGTNLRPTNGNFLDNVPPASPDVEAYLNDVVRELTSHVDTMKTKDTRKKPAITNQINSLLQKLNKREDLVVAPTDKTNSTILMETTKYKEMTKNHLEAEAARSSRERLIEIEAEAKTILSIYEHMLSKDEYNYIKTTITKKAIPTVKLLVKDHKRRLEMVTGSQD